jgi:hypothetical protein
VRDGADLEVGDELVHVLVVAQAGDAEDAEPALIFLGDVRDAHRLAGAGRAPGRPEPEDGGLAGQRGRVERLAVQGLAAELEARRNRHRGRLSR